MKFRFREGLTVLCDQGIDGTASSAKPLRLIAETFNLTGTTTEFDITSGFLVDGGLRVLGKLPTSQLMPNLLPAGLDSSISSNISLYAQNHIFASGRVFNAVYNDLAEFRQLKDGEKFEYGKCYIQEEDGITQSTSRLQDGIIGICTDTYGFALGHPGINFAPIALAGWVLAKIELTLNDELKIGSCLTSGPNGYLSVMTKEEIKENPDKIVAKFMGYNHNTNLKTNSKVENIENRCWVKVC